MMVLVFSSWSWSSELKEAYHALTEQWITAEKSKTQEEIDFELDLEWMIQLKSTLSKNIETWRIAIEKMEQGKTKTDEEREKWLARKKELESLKKDLLISLNKIEKELVSVLPKLPSLLKVQLDIPIRKINLKKQTTDWLERTKTVLQMMKSIHYFNRNYIIGSEEIKISDNRTLSVKVLYRGLSGAYFISKDSLSVGVGRAGAQGWHWQPLPEIQAEVEKAFAMLEGNSPKMSLVHLPVESVR